MPLLFIQAVRSANCWRRSDALCWKYESPVVSLLSPLPLLSLVLPTLLILVSLLSPLPFQYSLSPLASDHSPVSSRLSLLSVESFANYHSIATLQYEW